MPRFLVFAELGILCHVAYAYGVCLVLAHSVKEWGMVSCLAILLYSLY